MTRASSIAADTFMTAYATTRLGMAKAAVTNSTTVHCDVRTNSADNSAKRRSNGVRASENKLLMFPKKYSRQ